MKFIHLGDLHIGKIVNEINMIPDQKYILDQIFDLAIKEKADAVMIAGDIYDKSIPSEEAVKLLDEFLRKLAKAHIMVFAISGNHDSDERLNFGASLFSASDIYIRSKYEGKIARVDAEDDYGVVHIWMLPFVKASSVRYYYPEEEISSYDAAIRTAIAKADIKKEERNIILAHQFVTNEGYDPETAGSENTASEFVGTVEKVDVNVFDDFDYVALGHIHRPQKIGRDTARYSGSPLKYSLSEIGYTKSVPLVTMQEKGNVKVELVPLKPLRDMRRIKGKMSDLLKPENIVEPEDYLQVILTDEDIIPDAISRIRAYYPNVMKLSYENSHTKELENFDFMTITQQTLFEDLMKDFYKKVKGGEPSEEEWQILNEVAREAGVKNEA
ncbi:MAG: exonuclease SbcCD subunit D [Solobacterium sp.]|nr:exonuclease SbcCD subunit D [Solobacterium sp.]